MRRTFIKTKQKHPMNIFKAIEQKCREQIVFKLLRHFRHVGGQ